MELSWPPDGSSWRQVGPSWRSIGLKILMLKPSCGEVKTKCVLCILLGPSWGLSCGSSWPQMASRRSQDGRKLLARRSCKMHPSTGSLHGSLQGHTEVAQAGPRWPQDGLRRPQDCQMPNSCVESGKVWFTPQKMGSSELHCFCRKQAYPELPIFNGSNDSLKFSSNAAHSQGVRSLTTDSEKQVHAGFLMFNEFRHLFDPFLGLSWAILGPTCGHPEPT